MFKNILICSVLAFLICIPLAFATEAPGFKDKEYLALVDTSLQNPETADWTQIRTLYIQTSFYNDLLKHSLSGMLFTDLGKKAVETKTPAAIAAYKDEMRKHAGSLDTHAQAWRLVDKAPDLINKAYEERAINGLLHSILSTGDGRTMNTAYKALSKSEEYFLMRDYYKLLPTGQSLEFGNGHVFDVQRVKSLDGKDADEMFFNIDLFFGKMEIPHIAKNNPVTTAPTVTKKEQPPAPTPPSDKTYLDLVDAAMQNPAAAQWDAMRAIFPETTFYKNVGGDNMGGYAVQVVNYAAKRMSENAIGFYKKFRREYYASVDSHAVTLEVYKKNHIALADPAAEEVAYKAILQSAAKTGDGASQDTAFKAISAGEAAHIAMSLFREEPEIKENQYKENREYMVYAGADVVTGQPRTVYIQLDPRAMMKYREKQRREAQMPPSPADQPYLDLVDAAIKNPDTANWTEIRRLYKESSFYATALKLGRGDNILGTELAYEAVETKAPEDIAAYKDFLRKHAGMVDAQMQAKRLLDKLPGVTTPEYLKSLFTGTVKDLMQTGDGRGPQTAYKVLSVGEEYLLAESAYQVRPSGRRMDGKYDILSISLPTAEKIDIFFDTTAFDIPDNTTSKLQKASP